MRKDHAVPLMLMCLLLTACGPSLEETAARIINAKVTGSPFPSNETNPDWTSFECDDHKFMGRGKSTFTATATLISARRASIDILEQGNVFGPGIAEPTGAGEDKFSIDCALTAEYVYNPDTSHMVGGGNVKSCGRCKINGRDVDCDGLKEALRTYTCAG